MTFMETQEELAARLETEKGCFERMLTTANGAIDKLAAESQALRQDLEVQRRLLESDALTIRRLKADLFRLEGELARHKDNALTILHNLSPQDGGLRKDQVCDDPIGKALALIPYFSGELDRLREIEGRIAILRGK